MRSLAARLAACVLLAFIAHAAAEETAPKSAAILLTARAGLPDPNFRESVVLVSNNLGPGPVGVILNRPTSIPVRRVFPDIPALQGREDKIYFGGPVARGAVSFVFRADKAPEDAQPIVERLYFSRDERLLRTLLGRDRPMEGLRIFIGHAGWAPGQLEAEIARDDWRVEPATVDSVFKRRPEHPWPERQAPGKEHRG
jgi:putative transcriptional regulator